jgi:hypothetical protein
MSAAGGRAAGGIVRRDPCSGSALRFGLGFTETGDPVAVFALTAFLQEFSALKTLENIAFAAQSGRCAQAAML